jgi:peptide/nickel transport system substrate-binding protein
MEHSQRVLQSGAVSRRKFLGVGAASLSLVGLSSLVETSEPAGAVSASTIRVGWTTPPDVMNPFTFTTTASNEILWLIYDTLMEYDINLNPTVGLAAHRSISADGKSYTFKLRPNATWHDGKPVTANDIKYTFEVTAKNNLGQAAWTLVDFASVEIVNLHEVIIHYKAPIALDPALLIPIVPEHIWGSITPSKILTYTNSQPIGSGPFTFKKWVTGQYLQVDRYKKWWGKLPAAASIFWNQYENSDVMVQSLSSGQLDILTEVPPVLWNGLKRAANVNPVEMKSFSFHHIGFNVSKNPKSKGNPLLLDKTIRRALSYSLDRNQLVQLALAGRGIAGSVQLPPSFGVWQEKIPKDEQFNNDPTKAKALLDAAGYRVGANGVRADKGGKPLSFRLIAIQTTDEDVLAGQIFVKAAQQVGVKLTLQALDSTTLGNIVYNSSAPDWDIFIWGWDSASPDPDYLLSVDLTSQIGGNNDVFYSNPEYDKLYAEQAVRPTLAQRLLIVHEMQKLFYDDAAYCIMWYQSKLQAYRTDTWKGWVETRGGLVYNFTRSNYLTVTPK